jgi:hypothetical protein
VISMIAKSPMHVSKTSCPRNVHRPVSSFE